MANLSGLSFPVAFPPPHGSLRAGSTTPPGSDAPRAKPREGAAALWFALSEGTVCLLQRREATRPLTGAGLHRIGANGTSARARCALARRQGARLITLLSFSLLCSRGGIHFTGEGGDTTRQS